MIKLLEQKINSKIKIDSDDFFGLYENKSLEYKKLKTTAVYRYFFRFSIEKLQVLSNDIFFLILLFHYLKNDKLKRIKYRDVLAKNSPSYFRAVENLLNNS